MASKTELSHSSESRSSKLLKGAAFLLFGLYLINTNSLALKGVGVVSSIYGIGKALS